MRYDPPALFDATPVELPDPDGLMRRDMRRALIAVCILVFGFFLLAALVPIGGAVMAGGQVGIESRVKRIASTSLGVVDQIYVANGDHVDQGDPLIRLEATVPGTEESLSALTLSQLMAQRARLEAERLGAGAVRFPAELLSSDDPGARAAMADEARLFEIRRSETAGMRAQLQARIVQYDRQIQGYRAQIASLRKQSELIEPERAGVDELWEQELVTISRRNQLERQAADLEGSIASLEARIAETHARVTEAREQMLQLAQSRRADAGNQLATVNAAINDERVRNVAASQQTSRSLLTAPYSGIVDKLSITAVGDVVEPAQPVMEIVPDQDRLLVEVAVSPGDIDQVRYGQPARIRFTAFSVTSTPEIAGSVEYVAAERTTNPDTQASYYQVRVMIDQASLSRWPNLDLKPGMPAEVMIETGERSLLSYITKPLRDQFARAFRND